MTKKNFKILLSVSVLIIIALTGIIIFVSLKEKELSDSEKQIEFVKGSKIESIELTKEKIEDLKDLGLIWGFLKYYHPSVAEGKYNWDFELFRIMPKILQAKTNKQRDKYLLKWIKKLGEYNISKNTKKKNKKLDIKMEPDLDWIENSNYSEKLKIELLNIKNATRTGKNYYVELNQYVKNPSFENEEKYTNMQYPDTGYRLLSLYRYWNIIQYYFPYKYLIEEDWKNVLKEFIPKFVKVENQTEYQLVVLELITRIHDTHAGMGSAVFKLDRYWGTKCPPVEIRFVENKPVVTDFYYEEFGKTKETIMKETGLMIGDVITKMNDKNISDIIELRKKYTPASNYPTKLRDIADKLLRTNKSNIKLEIIRNGKIQVKEMKAYPIWNINVYKKYQRDIPPLKFINKDIAYLYLASLKNNEVKEIIGKVKNTKALIIDIRNYPLEGGFLALGDYLLPKTSAYARASKPSIKTPGLFSFTNSNTLYKQRSDYYKGKVVILVNELTQSFAEIISMTFRLAPNAIVIGSTTAGADGNVSNFFLAGNLQTFMSGIGIYYPDKTETQRVGIIPDIEVKPTIEGVRNKKDELLEKAIEIIKQK